MDYRNLTRNTKLVIYSFIGAFTISFLIGVIAQNPLGIILMRAFVSGVLFGGLIYAGLWVLKRYIPEFETVTGSQKITTEDEKGEAINYTLEDAKQVSHTIKVEEPNQVIGEDKKETEIGIEKAPLAPGEGDDTSEDEIPSLDRLFEDEETVPDVEIDQQAPKTDKRIMGDYITLGNVRIPNEPEVIAKAIKKVMKEDEGR